MFRWLLFFLLLPALAIAQKSGSESHFISVKSKNGFLAAHRGVMGHLPKEPALGVEVAIYKRFGGNKRWHDLYRFPYAGVTLYGSTVGNNAILGQGFGAYGFIEFPFNRGKFHQLTGKLSTGLGYITKVFDQETNPKDVA